jgi:phospholipase C
LGPSFPNHLFSIAANDDDADSNPRNSKGRWGCDSPSGATVEQRHADGTITRVFPCFKNIQTLGDLLTANNISWKYYAPGYGQDGYVWSSYDAIDQIRNTSQWQAHVVDYTQFIHDAASGNLPAVSWLVEPADVSDHPRHSVCAGENWTVEQMNALMNNPSLWATTAIILTWDDFGGFYDHVVPPQGPNSQIEYGFRVPTIIISPYAKAGFIDHTLYSFPSMLKFVEDIFALPSLGNLDNQANDMFAAFDFNQQPLPPLVLAQHTCKQNLLLPTSDSLLQGAQ